MHFEHVRFILDDAEREERRRVRRPKNLLKVTLKHPEIENAVQ